MTAKIKSLFSTIQSIPSPKAKPFKQWLVQVCYDRLLEREQTEKEIGRSVISYDNYLESSREDEERKLFDEQ